MVKAITVNTINTIIKVINFLTLYPSVPYPSGRANSISGVTVQGNVKADRAAGLVDKLEAGTITDAGISLNVQAQTAAAGMVGTPTAAMLSNSAVCGSYSAANGSAAGLVVAIMGAIMPA